MNQKEKNKSGFYIRMDEELKRKFNIKCLENGVRMSDVIKSCIKQYIEK